MKILLITQWYKPIKGAVKRMARMADHLAEQGHDVTVLTGFPSKPTGILPPKYHGKLWANETDGKVKILRTYEFPTPNEGVLKRLFNYFSFMVSASVAAFLLPPQDIVIVSSPSFFAGIPGMIAKWVGRGEYVFDVRDLWPDSAIDMGFLKSKWQIKIMETLEKMFYRSATIILTATPAIRKHIISEGTPEKKVQLLINSVDTDKFRPLKTDRKKMGLPEKDFIAVYTGTHSNIQDLETVVLAAKILKNESKIKFLFVGEGENKEQLINLVNKEKLTNCIFLSERPQEEIVKIINASDIGIVPILNTKTFKEAIPSKAFEYLACGKPLAMSVQGELRRIIEENNAGLAYRGGDAKGAAQTILELYKAKNYDAMSKNARKIATELFSDKKFYQTLDQVIV